MYQVKGYIKLFNKEVLVTVITDNTASIEEAIEKAKTAELYNIVSANLTNIKEIYYDSDESKNDSNPWFEVVLRDSVETDEGKVKRISYKILIQADNLDKAHQRVNQIIQQGYKMSLHSIKNTNYYLVF